MMATVVSEILLSLSSSAPQLQFTPLVFSRIDFCTCTQFRINSRGNRFYILHHLHEDLGQIYGLECEADAPHRGAPVPRVHTVHQHSDLMPALRYITQTPIHTFRHFS